MNIKRLMEIGCTAASATGAACRSAGSARKTNARQRARVRKQDRRHPRKK